MKREKALVPLYQRRLFKIAFQSIVLRHGLDYAIEVIQNQLRQMSPAERSTATYRLHECLGYIENSRKVKVAA